jgi:tRNA threonylcarbamoyladenosine biosynthesis protein TsaB
MKLLALDTSSLACSVALLLGDNIVERHEEQPREHTRLLVPMINEVLAEAGISSADLDGIVLGNGPGSFIGMRIATSVAQGMAFAAGIKVVPVSSLLAVAAETMAAEGAEYVAVCQDAHMNEVYLGLYRAGLRGLPALVKPERLHEQTTIAELQESPVSYVSAGFGWQRYPALLEANEPLLASRSSVLHPSARHLLPAGAEFMTSGAAVEPQDVIPAYLRQTVAARPGAKSP